MSLFAADRSHTRLEQDFLEKRVYSEYGSLKENDHTTKRQRTDGVFKSASYSPTFSKESLFSLESSFSRVKKIPTIRSDETIFLIDFLDRNCNLLLLDGEFSWSIQV
jgi:hypothetical protein